MSEASTQEEMMIHPEDHEFAIRIKGLENRFGDTLIHDNLDLDVRTGEILGIVGGSGTGPEGSRRSLAYKVGGGTDREATQLAVLAAGALTAVIVLLVLRRRRG